MSRINHGQIRVTLNEADAEVLMALVAQTHSSRTRILRLALEVYKALSDTARGATVIVDAAGLVETLEIPMPWDDDWDGLPERVEDHELSRLGATAQSRQHTDSAS